jgi:hypothetical protein
MGVVINEGWRRGEMTNALMNRLNNYRPRFDGLRENEKELIEKSAGRISELEAGLKKLDLAIQHCKQNALTLDLDAAKRLIDRLLRAGGGER